MNFVQEHLAPRPDLIRQIFEEGGLALRASRSTQVVRCVFHDDRTPSLSVDCEKGVFNCHGCGERGDVLSFHATRNRLTLEEAMADIRRRLGNGGVPAFRPAVALPAKPPPDAEALPPPLRARLRPITRDVPRIWSGLALSDRAGQQYLEGRHLWDDGLPYTGFFRFNTGTSCDDWMNARSAEGYRCAFAARRPDGTTQTIVLRHTSGGTSRYGKAPALPGCSTAGVAICRPEIRLLVEGDPEFEHDEIAIVEGPTNFIAFTLLRDALYCIGDARPSWTLGCIGAGQATGVVEAFARIIAGRVLRIALDPDEAGERNARLAGEAAHRVGAKRVLRVTPRGGTNLDVADLWRAG